MKIFSVMTTGVLDLEMRMYILLTYFLKLLSEASMIVLHSSRSCGATMSNGRPPQNPLNFFVIHDAKDQACCS